MVLDFTPRTHHVTPHLQPPNWSAAQNADNDIALISKITISIKI